MTPIRKLKDGLLQALTYIASSMTLIVLVMIFGFIVIQGKGSLSLEMLTNNYWSQNNLVKWNDGSSGTYARPQQLGADVYFSKNYGIALADRTNHEKQTRIEVVYLDDTSLFHNSVNATKGETFEQPLYLSVGDSIEKIDAVDAQNIPVMMGSVFGDTAQSIVEKLDTATNLESVYYKTPGGGIWGSLIATLILIGLSMVFALPLGIFAAIYLTEIAKPSRLTTMIERCIEMLAGVPSIVFGLMGIVVLYPVAAFFQVTGLSILLGALTMAVVLLPVIIRSVQESLLVVPQDYRLSSLSLGASQTQTIFKVILPSALPGILSAILLAVGRIIGESAALIYTMGTFINDAPAVNKGATTLAVHIWSVMGQEQPNFQLASAISIVILVLVLILNVFVKLLTKRLNKKLGV